MLLNPGAAYDYNGQRLTYPGHPARVLVRR